MNNFFDIGWIRTIRVHYCPDLDVFGAMGFIMRFAAEALNRVGEIIFVPAGQKLEELEGSLDLDTGGGPRDHHGKNGFCTTDLIASELGVADLPELQDLLRRFREQDLRAQDVLGGGYDINHARVSLKALIDGSHILDVESERDGKSTRTDSFWILVKAAEAIIAAAQNQNGFLSHGEWKDDLEEAIISFLWSKHADLHGDLTYPRNLNQVLDALDQGYLEVTEGAGTYREDEGQSAIVQFFSLREWFVKHGQWQPQDALFSICGIAYGLHCLGMDQPQRLQFLRSCILRLVALSSDESFGHADVKNNSMLFDVYHDRSKVRICAVKSDAFFAATAARKAGANVVIALRSDQTQVTIRGTEEWLQRRLCKVGITLRLAECLHRGRTYVWDEVKVLSRSSLAPEWYIAPFEDHPERAFLVSNRTLKNPVEPRTILNDCTIIRLVQNVIFYGEVPRDNVIRSIIQIGQKEAEWPNDPKKPRLFEDVRKVHG